MSVIHSLQPIYSALGFAVGLLIGLTGVGGGSLTTPLLILLFGIHPATAVGTDLLFAATTKTAGSLMHGINRTIDWAIVRRLATGSVPMTVISLAVLSHLDINSALAMRLIDGVLAIALFVTAALLVFRKTIISRYCKRINDLGEVRSASLTVGTGCVLGTLVSLSSVGAGAIGVTALMLLYPRLPMARIAGTDIAHAVPLTFAAGIGHWLLGSPDLLLFISLILGSVPGILVSSYMAPRIPEGALRVVLASILVIVAARLSFELHSALATPASIRAATDR
jgi:uncharacterized protein